MIKPGSTPSPTFIYLSDKTQPEPPHHFLSHPALLPLFFPDLIPILIIHLLVCYKARQDECICLVSLHLCQNRFDTIVIPYLSVLSPPAEQGGLLPNP